MGGVFSSTEAQRGSSAVVSGDRSEELVRVVGRAPPAGADVELIGFVQKVYDNYKEDGSMRVSLDRGNPFELAIFKSALESFDELMLWNQLNEFRLEKVEINVSKKLFEGFKAAHDAQAEGRRTIRLLFHGTLSQHTNGILQDGFRDEKVGQLDAGWYGKGHYFTPNLEYAVAYCQNKKKQIRRLNFADAIDVNNDAELLGCLVITGKKREIHNVDLTGLEGVPINVANHDSHEVFVDRQGELCSQERAHASEIVVPHGAFALPLFRLTVKRVKSCIVWVEVNDMTESNIAVQERLAKQTDSRVVIVTPRRLRIIARRKANVRYVFIASGQTAADVIRLYPAVRPLLVFCADVAKHEGLAQQGKVEVTDSEERVVQFAQTGKLKEAGGGCLIS